MAKLPSWEIRVFTKNEVLANFTIPAHRLSEHDIEQLLRAIYVRYRTESPEEMAHYYVNNRKGGLARLKDADMRRSIDPDRSRIGFYCGDADFIAQAFQSVSEKDARAMKKILEQNKAANAK